MKGKGKEKQVTGTFAVTATGRFLLIQLLYAGKTTRCYSQRIVFHMDFVTQSDNYWSNDELTIQHVHEVIYFLMWIKLKKNSVFLKSRRVYWFKTCLRDKLPKGIQICCWKIILLMHVSLQIWPTSFHLSKLMSTVLLKVFLKVAFKRGTQAKSQNRWMRQKAFMQ